MQSGSVNEIAVWNTKDGYHLYSFSMDSFSLIPSGQEEFSGSSFTKNLASKQGASIHKH